MIMRTNSGRAWSAASTFYAPRWAKAKYFAAAESAMATKSKLDVDKLWHELERWEEGWTWNIGQNFTALPVGDAVDLSRAVLAKHFPPRGNPHPVEG